MLKKKGVVKLGLIPGNNYYQTWLYDPTSRRKCLVEKTVDVSGQCRLRDGNPRDKIIFLYTRDSKGQIVEILRVKINSNKVLERVHFSFSDLERVNPIRVWSTVGPDGAVLCCWANKLSRSVDDLKRLIFENTPEK